MKIAEIKFYCYDLPLKHELSIAGEKMTGRRGYAIELVGDTGECGYGETAPLPGYSDESFDQLPAEFERLRFAVTGAAIPEYLEELSGLFDRWLGELDLSSSVRFGFETAILTLMARQQHIPATELLSRTPLNYLPVNALLVGDKEMVLVRAKEKVRRGYTCFKLKIGHRTVEEDISVIKDVRAAIGQKSKLRLDANRAWSEEQYVQFAEGVKGVDIEYIEEPLSDHSLLYRHVKPDSYSLPIALDETLRELKPEQLREWSGIRAAILKPTILGLEQSARFARVAIAMGALPVFSSCYESGLGLSIIAHLAAAFRQPEVPVGLDTGSIFSRDLLTIPLEIRDGQIMVDRLPDVTDAIDRHLLTEVSGA